jgi:hypothetical protein
LVFFPFLQVRLLEGPLAYSELASKSLKLDCSQKSPLKPKQNCWRFKEREREGEKLLTCCCLKELTLTSSYGLCVGSTQGALGESEVDATLPAAAQHFRARDGRAWRHIASHGVAAHTTRARHRPALLVVPKTRAAIVCIGRSPDMVWRSMMNILYVGRPRVVETFLSLKKWRHRSQ